MFDSQYCSLITITFLVQMLGLFLVIAYRMSEKGPKASLGLLFGILIMGSATVACLPFDTSAGISQGVALGSVATFSTLGRAAPAI